MRHAGRPVSNGVVGSAKRTMASGIKPSAITSPNCRNSTIVNPSSNSPFDNFLLLRDRTAPADDKGFLRRSHRAGGQNACVGSEPTPGVAYRTELPTQAQGWRLDGSGFPLWDGLVKLRGPRLPAGGGCPFPSSLPLARPRLPIQLGRFCLSLFSCVSVRSSGTNHPTGPPALGSRCEAALRVVRSLCALTVRCRFRRCRFRAFHNVVSSPG